MDRIFVCHKDYIDNKTNITSVLLKWMLHHYSPYYLDKVITVDNTDNAKDIIDDCHAIPVGDLNFVRSWLEKLDEETSDVADKKLTPIEIPNCLSNYINRKYIRLMGREIKQNLPYCDASKYFIKDITTLKKWNSLLYEGHDISYLIDDDILYSISEKVNFLSEYRVFVYNDDIAAVMNYLGRKDIFPNGEKISEMINCIKKDNALDKLKGYTIDIGIISHNDTYITVPIELHPFVACGLYGFCDNVVLDMLEQGYLWYRRYASHREN